MPIHIIRKFIRLESSSGFILFAAAILALLIDNSPLHSYYQQALSTHFSVQLGAWRLSKPIILWVNDGLMAIFFLLVGLEIKRELLVGELNSVKKASLPFFAAIGGMLVPAAFFFLVNHDNPHTLQGWAIPTATDIAFALGILAVLGSRIPLSLKIFLTALAIFDDIGAVAVIAMFYTKHISAAMLLLALLFTFLLSLLNRYRVMRFAPYMLLGVLLWGCVLKSGVHASLVGFVLALAIPLNHAERGQPSPLRRLESRLHPWVALFILPLFALVNAGVSFEGMTWGHLLYPLPLGIALGLFFGKQLGIMLAAWLTVKCNWAKLPQRSNWWGVYGISAVAGVGFTMSLFIGGLAFGHDSIEHAALVRMGILFGSLLAGMAGYLILRFKGVGYD